MPALTRVRPAVALMAGLVALALCVAPTVSFAQQPTAPSGGKTATPSGDKQAKPAQPKPEATGLEKLSADWPKWLKVGVVYRGRVEAVRPITGSVTDYDSYYLNRLRLSAAVQPSPWMQAFVQIHDNEAMSYPTSPAPTSVTSGFDVRQGYIEIGRKAPRGVIVSGGRMEYALGDGRLFSSTDWGNSSRTFDMARASAFVPGFKVDVFRGGVVQIDTAKFDRVKPGEYYWGEYGTFDKIKHVTLLDVYAFQKMTSVNTGELGSKGDGRVYTYGGRAVVPVTKMVSFDVGGAFQRGHLAADSVKAWGAYGLVSWVLSKSATKPKLTLECNFASGDDNPKDGVKRTFDQLMASNHAKYGFADLIAWRNMKAYQAKFEVSPNKKLKVNAALAFLRLATVNDSWYGSSGSKTVANAKATSRDIGWEPDLYATYAVSKELSLSTGVALLLPGDYVKQSTTLDRYWYPWAMWVLKF